MKLTIERGALLKHWPMSRAWWSGATHPILSNVQLSAEDGRLR